jgi:hypothetical protein
MYVLTSSRSKSILFATFIWGPSMLSTQQTHRYSPEPLARAHGLARLLKLQPGYNHRLSLTHIRITIVILSPITSKARMVSLYKLGQRITRYALSRYHFVSFRTHWPPSSISLLALDNNSEWFCAQTTTSSALRRLAPRLLSQLMVCRISSCLFAIPSSTSTRSIELRRIVLNSKSRD